MSRRPKTLGGRILASTSENPVQGAESWAANPFTEKTSNSGDGLKTKVTGLKIKKDPPDRFRGLHNFIRFGNKEKEENRTKPLQNGRVAQN
jgi:hypothetical protein